MPSNSTKLHWNTKRLPDVSTTDQQPGGQSTRVLGFSRTGRFTA